VYYLNILSVDFRFQRRGIGMLLLQEGISEGRKKRLPICLEASSAGERLYTKAGFQKVGDWEVNGMVLPVMRLL
jgi:predicted N-acetyltransferase YhbS